MEIYCPKCEWEPPASAEWTCECGHSWHTFDTHGQCPECGKVWRETQCHECTAWSPHHDWYHDLPPVDVDAITEGGKRRRSPDRGNDDASARPHPLVPKAYMRSWAQCRPLSGWACV